MAIEGRGAEDRRAGLGRGAGLGHGTARRGGVNARVVVTLVVLVVLMAVGMWWLMREDGPQQQGPRPPVVERENSRDEGENGAPGVRESARGAATPAANKDVGDAPKAMAEPVVAAAEEVRDRWLTIDGEVAPKGTGWHSAIVDMTEDRFEFSVTVSGRVVGVDGKVVAGATVWADTEVLLPSAGITRSGGAAYHVRSYSSTGCVLDEAARTTTDEVGVYSLRVKGWQRLPLERSFAWVSFQVSAKTEGSASGKSQIISHHTKGPFPEAIANVELVVGAEAAVGGHVVWGDTGGPVKGASVALTRPYVAEIRREGIGTDIIATPPAPLVRLLSGEKGEFTFKGVADGEYVCWAVLPGGTHAGWRGKHGAMPTPPTQSAKVVVRGGAAVGELRLEIHREITVVFRTKPELAESPGIALFDQASIDRGLGRTPEEMNPTLGVSQEPVAMPLWRATKRPDGAFVVPGVVPSLVRMWVFGKGYRPAMAALNVVAGREYDAGVIELDLGSVITGRVTDEAGRPLEGVTVAASEDARNAGPFAARPAIAGTAVTNRDGDYRVSGLVEGQYRVMCRLEGYMEQDASVRTERSTSGVKDFVLLRADAMLSGRIVWASGSPPRHTGQLVSVFPAESEYGRGLAQGKAIPPYFGKSGRVDVPTLADWTFSTALSQGKYKFLFGVNQEFVIVEQAIEAALMNQVTITVGRVSALRGTVLDAFRMPVRGATVMVIGPGLFSPMAWLAQESATTAVVKTDDDGNYEVSGLKSGKYLVWLPEFPEQQRLPDRAGNGGNTVSHSSDSDSWLGIVLGAGVEGAAVYLDVTLNGEKANVRPMVLNLDEAVGRHGHPGFFKLADGRFLATDVPAGTHTVATSVGPVGAGAGAASSTMVSISFTVAHGERIVYVTHDVKTAKVGGKVLLEAGRVFGKGDLMVMAHMVGVSGEAKPSGGGSLNMNVKGDGTFVRDHMALGWYRFEASARGYVTTWKDVEVTKDTFVELELGEKAGSIVLEFDGLEGEEGADALAEFIAYDMNMRATFLDIHGRSALQDERQRFNGKEFLEKGRLVVSGCTPGVIQVTLEHEQAEKFAATVVVTSGQETILKVKFRIGLKIVLTMPASDAPAEVPDEVGFYVVIRRAGIEGSSGSVHMVPQSDGSYAGSGRVKGSGEFVLRTGAGTISPETEKVTLAPGSSITHAFRMVPKRPK